MKNAFLILNYNGEYHLKYCIPNVLSYIDINTDVFVVDNNSTDSSLEYLKNFKEIKLISSNVNLGYAGGNNIGLNKILKLNYKYVFIANNDILINEYLIPDSIKYLDSNPQIGCLGFEVYGEFSKVDKDIYFEARDNYSQFKSKTTLNVPGMLLLIPCNVLKHVGLFDEIMFMYGEEDDLEFRILECGYTIEKCNIPIWHYSEGTTSKHIPLKSSYLSYRNLLRNKIKFENFISFTKHSLYIVLNVLFVKFPKNHDGNSLLRRKYPSKNRLILLSIVSKAIIWNLFNYRNTLKIRKIEINVRDKWYYKQ